MLRKPIVEAPWIDDPVLALFDLPRVGNFYPLGFAAEIRSNFGGVLLAAAESFGECSQDFFTPTVRLSIGVSSDAPSGLPNPPTYRSRGHLLSIISDTENFVVCDKKRGFAFGWVNQSVAENHQFFRYYFLEAASLSIIEELYLAPVHGALVEHDGCGILLCGHSGAGKSTLAYACARRGWSYITDDACSLVRGRNDRFGIGNPHIVRFREDAPLLFPELATKIPRVRANGKVGIEVSTSELPGISTVKGTVIEHVVFLNRTEPGLPLLRQFSKRDALDRFAQTVSTGDNTVRASQLNSYQRLLSAQFWEMRYYDLSAGVALLTDLASCATPVRTNL